MEEKNDMRPIVNYYEEKVRQLKRKIAELEKENKELKNKVLSLTNIQ